MLPKYVLKIISSFREFPHIIRNIAAPIFLITLVILNLMSSTFIKMDRGQKLRSNIIKKIDSVKVEMEKSNTKIQVQKFKTQIQQTFAEMEKIIDDQRSLVLELKQVATMPAIPTGRLTPTKIKL